MAAIICYGTEIHNYYILIIMYYLEVAAWLPFLIMLLNILLLS